MWMGVAMVPYLLLPSPAQTTRRTPLLEIAHNSALITGTPSLEHVIHPSFDTSILPQLVLEITLADASVLGSVAGIALDGTGATDITDDGTGAASFAKLSLLEKRKDKPSTVTSLADSIAIPPTIPAMRAQQMHVCML